MTFSDLTNTDKPVLVDFYADWCAPCRAMKPVLDNIKASMGDTVAIYKINVDKNQMLSERFQIRSIPTLLLFKNGEQVWRQSGVPSERELAQVLQSHLQ
jgi:thioredoxin 1